MVVSTVPSYSKPELTLLAIVYSHEVNEEVLKRLVVLENSSSPSHLIGIHQLFCSTGILLLSLAGASGSLVILFQDDQKNDALATFLKAKNVIKVGFRLETAAPVLHHFYGYELNTMFSVNEVIDPGCWRTGTQVPIAACYELLSPPKPKYPKEQLLKEHQWLHLESLNELSQGHGIASSLLAQMAFTIGARAGYNRNTTGAMSQSNFLSKYKAPFPETVAMILKEAKAAMAAANQEDSVEFESAMAYVKPRLTF